MEDGYQYGNQLMLMSNPLNSRNLSIFSRKENHPPCPISPLLCRFLSFRYSLSSMPIKCVIVHDSTKSAPLIIMTDFNVHPHR